MNYTNSAYRSEAGQESPSSWDNEDSKERSREDERDEFIDDGKDEGRDEEREESRNEQRYKDGETLTFVRVRFPGNARSFPFLLGKRKFFYGQKVMAMSDRGMTVGYINSFPYERPFDKSLLPLRTISKTASDEDIKLQQDYNKEVQKAEKICLKLIDQLKLDMTITHVEIIHYGKKTVFYFLAPERIDFRELVKGLVAELKMRIELRQISLRDRTAALGGVGVCGLQTCCSSFLQNYGNVSIKMAKNQNLALVPSKINGICGQLKCCIKYEDEVYSEKRSRLPKEGEFVQLVNGDRGRVDRCHLLVEQFEMLTDRGVKKLYSSELFDSNLKLPENYQFPREFENIIDESHTLIKLEKKNSAIIKEDDSALDDENGLEDDLESETENVDDLIIDVEDKELEEKGDALLVKNKNKMLQLERLLDQEQQESKIDFNENKSDKRESGPAHLKSEQKPTLNKDSNTHQKNNTKQFDERPINIDQHGKGQDKSQQGEQPKGHHGTQGRPDQSGQNGQKAAWKKNKFHKKNKKK